MTVRMFVLELIIPYHQSNVMIDCNCWLYYCYCSSTISCSSILHGMGPILFLYLPVVLTLFIQHRSMIQLFAIAKVLYVNINYVLKINFRSCQQLNCLKTSPICCNFTLKSAWMCAICLHNPCHVYNFFLGWTSTILSPQMKRMVLCFFFFPCRLRVRVLSSFLCTKRRFYLKKARQMRTSHEQNFAASIFRIQLLI